MGAVMNSTLATQKNLSHDRSAMVATQSIWPAKWKAALSSGLMVGVLLLVFPRGSPWENLSFETPAAMGRHLAGLSALATVGLHLILAAVYAFPIAWVAHRFVSWRGLVMGALCGLGLYGLNWFVFGQLLHRSQSGEEVAALVTHVLFALVAAAAYKGFVRSRPIDRSAVEGKMI